MNTKNDSYWSALADDIRFFRKGVISLEEMKNKYPDLDIGKGYSHWYNYEEAMYIVIPRECPFSDALELVFSTDHESKDQNVVEIRGWIFPYQKEWEQLPEIGELEKICAEKRDVNFRCSIYGDEVELRDCIKWGDRGDNDGYGMEDDIWLRALIYRNGEWKQPFHIHS